MKTIETLSGHDLRTYKTIFHHPVSHNLSWRDVHALFRHIGEVDEAANGNFTVTRHGETMVLHPRRTKDVENADEVLGLRHFIERTEKAAAARVDAVESHWLLVIDHREARIFRSELRGGVPQRILPHSPEDYFRHAPDSKDIPGGLEEANPSGFFAPLAAALREGGRILVFGSGTGTCGEMDQFVAWLKIEHPEQAERIVGAVVVDGSLLTHGQLLAKAREFYARGDVAAV